MTTPTIDDDAPAATPDLPPTREERRRAVLGRTLLGSVCAAALIAAGYAWGATTAPSDSSSTSPLSGYTEGADAVVASTGEPTLARAVAMGAPIAAAVDGRGPLARADSVATTALPAGHVLTPADATSPAITEGAVLSVSVRADQYPGDALRYGQQVAIVGAADRDYRARLVGLRPTTAGAAVLTLDTTEGQSAITDTLAHSDALHVVGLH